MKGFFFKGVQAKILSIKLFLLLLLASGFSNAHSRGESYSKWEVLESGDVQLVYTIKLKDINQLGELFVASKPGWQYRVRDYIESKTFLSNGGVPCPTKMAFSALSAGSYLQLEKTFTCDSQNELEITNNSLFDVDARHMHISRVKFSDGSISEKVFLAHDRSWRPQEINEKTQALWTTLSDYLFLGADHIFSGWDHLAFLACILILAGIRRASIKQLIVIITGFTLGHSFSLVVAGLGILKPDTLVVESLIAFSIAMVAMECLAFKQNSFPGYALSLGGALLIYLILGQFIFRSAIPAASISGLILFSICYFLLSNKQHAINNQYILTTTFGLIHGFGFAGSLLEIGLPNERLLPALLSFNIGVELGQLVIVLAVLSGLRFLRLLKINPEKDWLIEVSCACLAGLGCFWFIERSIL